MESTLTKGNIAARDMVVPTKHLRPNKATKIYNITVHFGDELLLRRMYHNVVLETPIRQNVYAWLVQTVLEFRD